MKQIKLNEVFMTDYGRKFKVLSVNYEAEDCYNMIEIETVEADDAPETVGHVGHNELAWLTVRGFHIEPMKVFEIANFKRNYDCRNVRFARCEHERLLPSNSFYGTEIDWRQCEDYTELARSTAVKLEIRAGVEVYGYL